MNNNWATTCDNINIPKTTLSLFVFWYCLNRITKELIYFIQIYIETEHFRITKNVPKSALNPEEKVNKHRKNCECCPVSLLIVR